MKRTELFLREFEKLIGGKLEAFPDPFKPGTYVIPDTNGTGYIETDTGFPVFVDENKGIKSGLDYNTAMEFYHFCKVFYGWV